MENNLIVKASNENPIIVTPSHFFQFATHPQWIWYDCFGDLSKKQEISEFTLKLMENGLLHEESYIFDYDRLLKFYQREGHANAKFVMLKMVLIMENG